MSEAPLAALTPLLAALRTWAPVYRRWWERSRRHGVDELDTVSPWSSADEDRVALLAGLDPARLVCAAGRLERLGAEIDEIGAAVATVAAAGIGSVAEASCAGLAASTRHRAAETGALAASMRAAGSEIGALLDGLAHRVLRATEGVGLHGHYAEPESAHLDIDRVPRADGSPSSAAGPPPATQGGADPDQERRRVLDELVDQQAAALRVLRAEVATVLEQLPVASRPVAQPEPGWCSGERGCPAGSDDVWLRWRPGRVETAPEFGVGPILGGTEGVRPESVSGVRIAELPER